MIKGLGNIVFEKVFVQKILQNDFDDCLSCIKMKQCWYGRGKNNCYLKKKFGGKHD